MATAAKPSAIPAEEMAELQKAVQDVVNGVRDPEKMRQAAEEMEQLANALLGTSVTNRDEAYGALMRSIMQLPDYLERLQSGHRDIPMVLLPLLNDLRGARGETLWSPRSRTTRTSSGKPR